MTPSYRRKAASELASTSTRLRERVRRIGKDVLAASGC